MSFPCISCGVILASSGEQREHYKSEWHRYNLKRKVVSLPPVTIEEFNIKSALFSKAEKQDPGSGEEDVANKDLPYCQACHKKFSGPKAYANHVASRKHKQREEEAKENPQPQQQQQQQAKSQWVDAEGGGSSSEGEGEEGEDEGPSPLGQEECLFCQHVAPSLEANCIHMLREHGFALPDPDLVSDLEGLVTLLDYKVGVGHECLWCHGARRFGSLRAVRNHMLDRGHCRYNLAGEHAFDLAEFYDFGGLGGDGAADADAGSESDSDGDSEAPTDLEAFELVLPSGAVVGHRSLLRYYRQSPAPERALALRAGSAGSAASRLLAQYRAVGWHGGTRTQAEVVALRDRAFVQRHRQRAVMHLGMGANRLQKHFRHQNPK